MDEIVFYTQAYNAEKTLSLAVDSVLSQTRGDFVYYLLDNGSTDKTGEIIRTYAEKDKRIKTLYNEQNNIWVNGGYWLDFLDNHDDNCYFCSLDADDEYYAHFLEYSMNFLQNNQLDIAISGSDFIDAASGSFVVARKLEKDMIIEGALFDEAFPEYHQFMRTVWGKLYKVHVMRRWELDLPKGLFYGSDTIVAQVAIRRANRVGILAKSLHKFYISQKSGSYQLQNMRIESDQILDDATRKFLLDKCGFVSPQNDRFLQLVYLNAVHDTLAILLRSDLPYREKLQNLRDMITHKKTQALFHSVSVPDVELNSKLRAPITYWLLSQKESRTTNEGAKATVEMLFAMYADLLRVINSECLSYIIRQMPELVEKLILKDYRQVIDRLNTWYKRHDSDNPLLTELELTAYRLLGISEDGLFTLLTEIKNKRSLSAEKIDVDAQITELMAKHPLLKDVSAGLASAFSRTVCWILKEDYAKALYDFLTVSEDAEITDGDAEAYILFGVNLSAAAENADSYIYFKKVWISYLIDSSRMEESKTELDEFERMLPDDEDFAELRKRMQ